MIMYEMENALNALIGRKRIPFLSKIQRDNLKVAAALRGRAESLVKGKEFPKVPDKSAWHFVSKIAGMPNRLDGFFVFVDADGIFRSYANIRLKELPISDDLTPFSRAATRRHIALSSSYSEAGYVKELVSWIRQSTLLPEENHQTACASDITFWFSLTPKVSLDDHKYIISRTIRSDTKANFKRLEKILPEYLALGQLCRLLASNTSEKDADICIRNFGVAYALNQYRFDSSETPKAYISWAHADDWTFANFCKLKASSLRPEHWHAGPHNLIVDAVGDPATCTSLIADIKAEWQRNEPMPCRQPEISRETTMLGSKEYLGLSLLLNPVTSVAMQASRVPQVELIYSAGTASDYNLKKSCIQIDPNGTDQIWVDRYGGIGIGNNGGSGRAGNFNQFNIKGIGRTPLVSPQTSFEHASGGAYLEEAVRETIFSEIFFNEAPWSAIRTLGIADTGQEQHWPPIPSIGFKGLTERRVLIIRDPVIRMAHFQRASFFNDPSDICADSERVKFMRSALGEADGSSPLAKPFVNFFGRWLEQCAYAYAWRLSPGAISPSNISIDGRLLDFGAASAVKNWSLDSVYEGIPPVGYELDQVLRIFDDYASEVKKEGVHDKQFIAEYDNIRKALSRRYYLRLGIELLRLGGLCRPLINRAIANNSITNSIVTCGYQFLSYHRNQHSPNEKAVEASPEKLFDSIWTNNPSSAVLELSKIAKTLAPEKYRLLAVERLKFRIRSRDILIRNDLSERLHNVMSSSPDTRKKVDIDVKDIINSLTITSRRDTWYDPVDSVQCGFAQAGGKIYSLYQRKDLDFYAILESKPHYNMKKPRRYLISRNDTINNDRIEYMQFA